MEKIQNAEKLVKKPNERPKDKAKLNAYYENVNAGIKEYKRLCISEGISPDIRLKALQSFAKHVPDEGNDMLIRLQDSLRFLRGEQLKSTVRLLVGVTRSSGFNSHQRVSVAVCLYNNFYYDVCYHCFADLANDRSLLVKYRVEASRYLFGSEVEENIEAARQALQEIIDTESYPSEYRYKVIAGFISRTGISTMMNFAKIKVPYDEEFVYQLQNKFFFNPANGSRERILSGQHLLQMDRISKKERASIEKELLRISQNSRLEENLRADAADVLLREGTTKTKKKARSIITDLGYSPVGKGLAERAKTIYSDSQNIHNETIGKCIERFIEKIIHETNVKLKPFHEVHQEVCDLVRKSSLKPRDRHRAYKALNRVSIDTATFTKYKVSVAEIFVHVWIRISSHEEKERKDLERRMIEELVDMADTCSSGHSGRFINVLSVYDNTIKISWEDQIKANITGRLLARIRNIKDEDLQAKVSLGMLEDADPEDAQAYRKFIEETLKDLRKELYSEFVGEGYISEDRFNSAFKEGSKDL